MMGKLSNINLDKLIFQLLCLYALFIPLELILEVFFNVETILKPYRIFAILIIVVFAIKSMHGFTSNREIKQDLFLYLIFGYGIIVTLYRMISTPFHLGYLYNDAFQISLYIGVFIVIRHTVLSKNRINTILKFLVFGVFLNSYYVFHNYYILQGYRREGGFMDNPNYLALTLVITIILFLLYKDKAKGIYKKILWFAGLIFLIYIFILAGSRSGLAVLAICFLVVFYFSSFKQKINIVALAVIAVIFLEVGGSTLVKSTGPLILVNRIQKKTTKDPRIPVWKGIIKASQETNFVGLGIGQFKGRFHEFYYEENNEFIKILLERNYFLSPHSDYFAILIVYGLLGLLFYLAFLIKTGQRIVYKIRNEIDYKRKIYYRQCFLIFLALVLFGVTAENFTSPLYWILLSLSTKLEFLPVLNSNSLDHKIDRKSME
jgi:O-antigen ligase